MNLQMRSKSFFKITKTNLHVQFHNEGFVVMVLYPADVFVHLNDTNSSLHSRDVAFSDVKDKVAGLTAQMEVWQA